MIPILYNGDETRFITNGIGRLSSCTRCVVTEERNGIYELEIDMPITGEHFADIALGKIIASTHDDRHDIQPFVIYQRSVPDLNGIVTFNAHHISYKLNDVVVMPYSAESVASALQGISDNSVNANPFTFWTDKTTAGAYINTVPRNARNMLGGEENSILDVFGAGDYEFDKFDVKLYQNRGTDSDVEIRYSKNLVGLSQTIDDSDSYNAVVPYWAGEEGTVLLPERMIVFSGTEPQTTYLTDHNLIIIRTENDEPIEVAYTVADAVPMDLSDVFEEKPTEEQLRAAAIARFEQSGAWLPKENLTIDFVQLWQTEEYKEYSALQRVSLCDTVSVFYPQAGISKVKQKVVKVEYNVLLDRYDSIELGTPQTSLGQAIQTEIMENVPTKSMMDAAIQYATDLIRGGYGGYVVMTPGPEGYPQEILIMDSPDTDTAVNVWRFNQNGLGHSSNGYQGPFDDIAITQDGKINASMITVGTMSANRIRGGTLEIGGLNESYGTISVLDTSSNKLAAMTAGGYMALAKQSVAGKYSGIAMDKNSLIFLRKEDRTFTYGSSDIAGTLEMLLELGTSDPILVASTKSSELDLRASNTAKIKLYPETKTYGERTYTIRFEGGTFFYDTAYFLQGISVTGTKSRQVQTDNYSDRKLYCYETPTPLFGDIGETIIGDDGYGFVDIDDIFTETIAEKVEYQVFLQREGEGDCYVAEKTPRYFVVKGTPGLKVAWELKAKQKDYEMIRLEQLEGGLEEYAPIQEDTLMESYITEQEEILYG